MKPAEVRSQLVDALRVDLVGPDNGSDLEAEVLSQAPSRWYLTGFLVPLEADPAQKIDDTSQDEFDFEGGDAEAGDDDTIPETPASRRAFFPSSIGLSLLVTETTEKLRVIVQWGDYRAESPSAGEHAVEKPAPDAAPRSLLHWHRSPRHVEMDVDLPAQTALAKEEKIPGSEGLRLAVSVRSVQALGIAKDMVPAGSRSISVFLVNRRDPLEADEVRDSRFIFQASLEVWSPEPLVARPDIRGVAAEQGYASSIDPDQRVADLQYRDVCEYAVGHGIATQADVDEQGHCRRVRTCWIPAAEVERIAPASIPSVELRMETLAQLVDATAAK
ncbi:MAG: helicase, partial [Isosphaeraceae bacterium]